jgi:hypothetical protein
MMNMISFAHFENFDKQPNDFKNGSEKEKSEFDSFMLAFSFVAAANIPENPKFELNSDEANVAVEAAGDKGVFPDESKGTTNDFQEFEEVFLPNDKPAFPIDKNGVPGKIQSDFFLDRKGLLQSEAFADLKNFGKPANLNSEEKDFVNKTISETFSQTKSPDLNVIKENTLQTEVENSTASIPVITDPGKSTDVPSIRTAPTASIPILTDSENSTDVPSIRIAPEVSADPSILPIENETLPTGVAPSDFHVEMASDNENLNLTQDLNLKMNEQTRPESIRKFDFDQIVESQKSEQPKDAVPNPVKKVITEAEIEQIMESKFLASEIEQQNPEIEKNPLKTAEKINLWQFKSPEFPEYKNISDIISETSTVSNIESIQDSEQFKIENTFEAKDEKTPVTSDISKTENSHIETGSIINSEVKEVENSSIETELFSDSEIIEGKDSFGEPEQTLNTKNQEVKPPVQNAFLTNDTEIIDVKTPTQSPLNFPNETSTPVFNNPTNNSVSEIPQNVIETEQHLSGETWTISPTNEIESLSNIDDVTIANTEIENSTTINEIAKDDTNAPVRNDLGEKIISNLSNRPQVVNFPQGRRLEQGEKTVENLSDATPEPIHRSISEELNAGDITRKFPKLIHKVSEYFGKTDPVKRVASSETENLLNIGDIEVPISVDADYSKPKQSDVPTVDTPDIIPLNITTQDPDINENNTPDILVFDGKTEIPNESPIQLNEQTDSQFELVPPAKNQKPQTELPKTQNPGKSAEMFRVSNSLAEGGNWTEVKFENQNSIEQTELNEQIELPVSEQVENPIMEYLTSEENIEKPEILKLRLRPAELGMVEVRLEKHISGKLEVHFQAENEQAKQVLAESFEKLRESLQNNGWQIGRLEISNSLLSSNGFKNGGENPSGSETPQSYNGKTDNAGSFSDENDDLNQNEPDRLVNLRA